MHRLVSISSMRPITRSIRVIDVMHPIDMVVRGPQELGGAVMAVKIDVPAIGGAVG